MAIVNKKFTVECGIRVSFRNITDEVKKIVAESGIKEGLVNVYSQHTSCSVFIQEDSEDTILWDNTPLVLQDMVNAMEKIIPTCEYEGQYLHPGPTHVKHAMEWRSEKPEWLLNTDAHLRSVLLGRSETIPVVDGEPVLGEFGIVYFVDFDQTRERTRTVRVTVIGE